MSRSEYAANIALATPHARAAELARWSAVLARPAVRKPAARPVRGLFSRLFNI